MKKIEFKRDFRKDMAKLYNSILEEREKIVRGFIAETGLKPSEIETVEQGTPEGFVWYVRPKQRKKILEPGKMTGQNSKQLFCGTTIAHYWNFCILKSQN